MSSGKASAICQPLAACAAMPVNGISG